MVGVDRLGDKLPGDGTVLAAMDAHIKHILTLTNLPKCVVLCEKNLGYWYSTLEANYRQNPRVVFPPCCVTATSGINQTRPLKAIIFGELDSAIKFHNLRLASKLFSAVLDPRAISELLGTSIRRQRIAGDGKGGKFIPRVVGDDAVVGLAMGVWYARCCLHNPRVTVLENLKGPREIVYTPGKVSLTPPTRALVAYLRGLQRGLKGEPFRFCAKEGLQPKHLAAVRRWGIDTPKKFFIQMGFVEGTIGMHKVHVEHVPAKVRYWLLHPV